MIALGRIYINAQGHRLQPHHVAVGAGRVNARVHVHNFTTGYDEAWSVRLFLAEHTPEDSYQRAVRVEGDV